MPSEPSSCCIFQRLDDPADDNAGGLRDGFGVADREGAADQVVGITLDQYRAEFGDRRGAGVDRLVLVGGYAPAVARFRVLCVHGVQAPLGQGVMW